MIDEEVARRKEGWLEWRKRPGAPNWPLPGARGTLSFLSRDGKRGLHVTYNDRGLFFMGGQMAGQLRFGNFVTIEVDRCKKTAETDRWLRDICHKFFDWPLFDYGFCCASDQYRETNIDKTGGGARAIGLDVSKYLPGFYWGNYFGEELRRRIPALRDPIPEFDTDVLSHGLFLANRQPPWRWQDESFRDAEARARSILGDQFFFHRGHPGSAVLFHAEDPDERTNAPESQ